MTVRLRCKTDIPLIGQECDNLGGARLPSIRDVLRVFFHKHNTEKLTVRDSARAVSGQVIDLWAKTKIPVILPCHIINAIISLHKEWKNVMSHETRTGAAQKKNKTESFCSKLDRFFDISKRNALVVMANDPDPATREDRDFLIAQQTNRGGYIANVDPVDARIQRRKQRRDLNRAERNAALQERKERETAKRRKLGKFTNVILFLYVVYANIISQTTLIFERAIDNVLKMQSPFLDFLLKYLFYYYYFYYYHYF